MKYVVINRARQNIKELGTKLKNHINICFLVPSMIQTQGFTASQVSSLAYEINRWLVTNTKEMDTKFRLINIKYAAIESGEGGAINYSALAIYEVGEIKKTNEA